MGAAGGRGGQTQPPGPTALSAPSCPSFSSPHSVTTPGTHRRKESRRSVLLSRKSPTNPPLCLLRAAHSLCIDSRVLTVVPGSLDNTMKTLPPGRKSNPFQKPEKSQSLATHSFNILVDNMPWTPSIFHFLFVLFPVISKAFIKSIKT